MFYVSEAGVLECVEVCVQGHSYLYGDECLTAGECTGERGGFVYEVSGERLCLGNENECLEAGGYVSGSECLVRGQCAGGTPYWDPVNTKCVEKCEFGVISEKHKVCKSQECTGGLVYDPQVKKCVRECTVSAGEGGVCTSCGVNAPYWSLMQSKCVSACPVGLTAVGGVCPTCYGDAGMRSQNKVYYDEAKNECVAHCHWADDAHTNCVTCSGDTPFWNSMVRKCVAACPIGSALSNGVCPECGMSPVLLLFDEASNKCVRQCPEVTPFFDSRYVCSVCPDYQKFWDGKNCVWQCESDKYHQRGNLLVCDDLGDKCNRKDVCDYCVKQNERRPFWNGKKCVSCAIGTNNLDPYLDKVNMRCTSQCPDSEPLIGVGYICSPCPIGAPYWNYFECKSCAGTFSGTRDYWSSDQQTCVSACPKGLEPVDGSERCRTCAEVD